MPDFIPGLRLGGLFYLEAVKPILDRILPGLQHSAALIGTGSEILDFDTEMSRDNDRGRAGCYSSEKMITTAR